MEHPTKYLLTGVYLFGILVALLGEPGEQARERKVETIYLVRDENFYNVYYYLYSTT